MVNAVTEAIPVAISCLGNIVNAFSDAFGISEQAIITACIAYIAYLGYKAFRRNAI